MLTRTFLLVTVGAAAAFTFSQPVAPPAHAPRYAITDLGTVHTNYCVANGINNAGEAVGEADGHAFLWRKGNLRDLELPGGFAGSRAAAINDAGWIVGTAYSGRQGQVGWRAHPVLWQADGLTDLGSLGGEDGSASAINNKSQVVGKSYDPQSGVHAFLWQDGKMTKLCNGSGSQAEGINDAGLVVGHENYLRAENGSVGYAVFLGFNSLKAFSAFDPIRAFGKAVNAAGQATGQVQSAHGPSLHAFLYSSDKVTDLGTLGGSESGGEAINGKGQVVGWSNIAAHDASTVDRRHAFLWTGDKMIDLNSALPAGSGWELAEAHGVNDLGQIVGVGSLGGRTRGFLLTPARQ